jgi:hypothetical protein
MPPSLACIWLNFTTATKLFCLVTVFQMIPSLHRLHKCHAESSRLHATPSNFLEILQQVFHFHETHGTVVFCWVPGHIGLPGNEVTDVATKEAAVLRNLTSDWALSSDVYAYLHCAVLSLWQDEWTQTVGKKFWMVKLTVEVWCSWRISVRAKEIMVMRIWIGHTHLVRRHLLSNIAPVCNHWYPPYLCTDP